MKDPLYFVKWLEKIDKVASLINKDPYKPALAKSQGSFSRTISLFPPSVGWHRIKEWLCYNFSQEATKQHVASVLIDQQQTTTETLQEYIYKDFWTCYSNPVAYYCIRQKIWTILPISFVIYITKSYSTIC